jgi:hypothetical protein
MIVEPLAITRYKIHSWYDILENKIVWGVDVIIDGHSYHVKDTSEPLIFQTKSEAIKHVRKLNKELRDKCNNQTPQP